MNWDAAPPTADELGSVATLPQGGAWDAEPPKPDELADTSFKPTHTAGEIAGNALKDIVQPFAHPLDTLTGLGEQVKTGAYDLPKEATESLAQTVGDVVTGKDTGQTPIGKRITDIQESPYVKDPLEEAIKHPVNTAALAAVPLQAFGLPGAALGAARDLDEAGAVTLGPGEGSAEEGTGKILPKKEAVPEANYLQSLGSRGMLNHAGISEETLAQMTPRGALPGDVGAQVSKILSDDDILAQTKNGTLKNALKAEQEAGASVENVVNKINSAGVAPVHDMSVVEPIQSKYAEMMQSPRAAVRRLATQWKETAQSLTQKAGDDGVLTLDDIRSELQEVGETFDKYERDSPQWKNNARIYGQLANIRDKMVSDIAEAAGNPKLAQALKQANARYSLYSRIIPDIKTAAAAEATGELEPGFGALIANEVKPLLSKMLLRTGGAQSKYGPILIDAAQKGQANLLLTHHILKQHDAEYARLMGDLGTE